MKKLNLGSDRERQTVREGGGGQMSQGSLTEVEGSVQLTSSYLLVQTSFFLYRKYYNLRYLKEEVNSTQPFPSVSVPCFDFKAEQKNTSFSL